jgi:hypothetical protein
VRSTVNRNAGEQGRGVFSCRARITAKLEKWVGCWKSILKTVLVFVTQTHEANLQVTSNKVTCWNCWCHGSYLPKSVCTEGMKASGKCWGICKAMRKGFFGRKLNKMSPVSQPPCNIVIIIIFLPVNLAVLDILCPAYTI